jgi:ergothioneine biosynthesis protein EgtB
LETEDYVVQSMTDASPAKWHLGHTTWVFEAFILDRHDRDFLPHNPKYNFLFNSYYNTMGDRQARPRRGLLTRPTVAEVYAYREAVDEAMIRFLEQISEEDYRAVAPLVILGLNHEQQHQELLLTDLKHLLSANPLKPAYRAGSSGRESSPAPALQWIPFEAGLREIGYGGDGFHYDNEGPLHRYHLNAFHLATRLVTCGEYLEFMEDGGYQDPLLWLSDGWTAVTERAWAAPLYWERESDGWHQYTLTGYRPVDPAEPVTHISYYEADAFARWYGARLATEQEWETACETLAIEGNFVEDETLHPRSAPDGTDLLTQMFGDAWEWTASAYLAYPGFRPEPGAVGEYNGKFMCSQHVLRGGSCATSRTHIRKTYRNFFYPDARWQFSGIRLAKDA